ncbi:subtilisin-like serine protease QhpE [Oceanobacter mangrovi]|uniref:subtilisin-like serine protease QhpE n=1 Tax=Oceanobacter mangrovi TaxID=2862510 RepID=UPI001C8D438F|nr:S8 family serine peptidase [Oceanobacter mangrovi]
MPDTGHITPVRVGIVDSGLNSSLAADARVVRQTAFVIEQNQLWQDDAQPDRSGHGSDIARIILSLAPECELVSAQVFQQGNGTTAMQVAAAIEWLVDQGCEIINLSLGLRQDRPTLKCACEIAAELGVILVAASPAQGEPVFPAAYPEVIRATGDARCDHPNWVYLATEQADVAGCVRPLDNQLGRSGASMGCAHITGLLAHSLRQFQGIEYHLSGSDQALHWLHKNAHFRGREYRQPVSSNSVTQEAPYV